MDRAVQRPVRCRQALDVYLHRLRGGIGAMAAALGGADALVFTGGVGEHAWQIREQALEGLDFLGVAIDRRRNATADGDCELTAEGAPARTVVVRAREDLEMARQVRARLLTPAADPVPSHEHQATLR